MAEMVWNEKNLNQMLTAPSSRLVEDMAKVEGDIMVLGAGGKMGPDLCILAQKASQAAGVSRKVYAVSRFSDPDVVSRLTGCGVEVIAEDLLSPGALEALPDCPNIIFMAGKKFSTRNNEHITWAMNTYLPGKVIQRFPKARIVVFSSGNLYPKLLPSSGGATEQTATEPVGEYCMSCLGRERIFEYSAKEFGTRVAIMRLNYAVDLRYGVLHDIAQMVLAQKAIDLSCMPCFNCIWQKDANEAALRLLVHASEEVFFMNVTGPEIVGVRDAAGKLGQLLHIEPVFVGEEAPTAYLSNAGKMFHMFGYPTISLDTMIGWQADWLRSGGRSLGKPTHFEERNGNY